MYSMFKNVRSSGLSRVFRFVVSNQGCSQIPVISKEWLHSVAEGLLLRVISLMLKAYISHVEMLDTDAQTRKKSIDFRGGK